MFQIKSTGFLNPRIRIREKCLRMRNMTSERSEMALDLYLVWTNYFSLSRWLYLILGHFLALNRRENLDKISWFVLLLDSGAAHVSTCTFRYKNKTEKQVVVNYRTTAFPTLHPPVQCCGNGSGIRRLFLTPGSGIRDGKKIQSQDQGSEMNISISFLG